MKRNLNSRAVLSHEIQNLQVAYDRNVSEPNLTEPPA